MNQSLLNGAGGRGGRVHELTKSTYVGFSYIEIGSLSELLVITVSVTYMYVRTYIEQYIVLHGKMHTMIGSW